MKTHIQVVGVLHAVWNGLHLAAAALVALLYFGGTSAVGAALRDAVPEAFLPVLALLVGLGLLGSCVLIVPALPGFVAGLALLRFRPWARWVVVLLSVLYLFELGPGTVLGVYSLLVLLSDRASFVFATGDADLA